MSFDENAYLRWYIPKLSPFSDAINLHSSGVPPAPLGELKSPLPKGFEMLGLVEEQLAGVLEIPKEQVIFTPGATGGTLLALLTFGDRQGNLVVETPVYEPMMRQADRLGEVRVLKRTFHQGWQIDLERAEEIIDDRTRLVLITEPNNPSGVFSSRESVIELADICRAKGALLLINEVYLGYSLRKTLHAVADNVLIVNSYSKLLGSYANRIGWVSGSEAIISRLRWASLNTGAASSPAAAVGIGFAKQVAKRTATARKSAANGVDVVDEWIRSRSDVEWIRPEGPGFGAIQLPSGIDDLDFVNRLYEKRNVLAVPGALFLAPGILRISWLGAGGRLGEGLDIIADELDRTP